jgi:hypothetical protein
MSERRQVHNSTDTKFKVQGAMKVDLPASADLARKGKELLREAAELADSVAQGEILDNAEQEVLYNSRIAALSTLATAHFTAANYYWEDR